MTESKPEPINTLEGSLEDQPLHLIVSHFNGATWVKPSRPCSRHRAMGLLSDALYMMQASDCRTLDPAECPLRAFLTVDQDQTIPEEG